MLLYYLCFQQLPFTGDCKLQVWVWSSSLSSSSLHAHIYAGITQNMTPRVSSVATPACTGRLGRDRTMPQATAASLTCSGAERRLQHAGRAQRGLLRPDQAPAARAAAAAPAHRRPAA